MSDAQNEFYQSLTSRWYNTKQWLFGLRNRAYMFKYLTKRTLKSFWSLPEKLDHLQDSCDYIARWIEHIHKNEYKNIDMHCCRTANETVNKLSKDLLDHVAIVDCLEITQKALPKTNAEETIERLNSQPFRTDRSKYIVTKTTHQEEFQKALSKKL